jgi:hypothetical protein
MHREHINAALTYARSQRSAAVTMIGSLLRTLSDVRGPTQVLAEAFMHAPETAIARMVKGVV